VFRGSIARVSWALPLLLGLASCGGGRSQSPAIGEAYVGPSLLNIRADIPLESRVVATVKHGDRLVLLQKRRRFLRVRTPSGVEGWTDEPQLLAKEDMDKLRELARQAALMPVQGQATTFGVLNVHTQPSRQSPGFLQIKENEKVDVLLHQVAPRTELERKTLVHRASKKAGVKKPKETKYPPLALPKPPPVPPDWLDLSKTDLPAGDLESAGATKDGKPVPTDDWSLIRTRDGESGWVLTGRLVMAIPDEVAQYAEGRRIVSYFPLGEVADGDLRKSNWLWTTIGGGNHPYDFDSFRVFIWSLRRHRYETAYIARNVEGHAPVLLKQVELSGPGGTSGKYPGFSICLARDDGTRVRREYAFVTNVVRFAGEIACDAASSPATAGPTPVSVAGGTSSRESLRDGLRRRWHALTRRWFGG
jgi:hypothetical protein